MKRAIRTVVKVLLWVSSVIGNIAICSCIINKRKAADVLGFLGGV